MDAFAHKKFIIYNKAAMKLFDELNLTAKMDDGFIDIEAKDGDKAVEMLRNIRFWQR